MILQASANMVDLNELMNMMCQNRVRAMLRLDNGGRHGEIYFDTGRIVHASCGGRQGEPALFELLAWGNSDVQVFPVEDVPLPTIERGAAFLFLESARLQDERRRFRDPTGT